MFLGGTAAAAGIALINAVGNLGGFVGPAIMGALRDATGGYTGGLLALAGALVVEAVLVLSCGCHPSARRSHPPWRHRRAGESSRLRQLPTPRDSATALSSGSWRLVVGLSFSSLSRRTA